MRTDQSDLFDVLGAYSAPYTTANTPYYLWEAFWQQHTV